MTMENHIAKWWDVANERRARLIKKKHLGGGLTKQQEAEYLLLQGISELVLNYAVPLDFTRLEELERKVHRLAHRIAKASRAAQREKGN